MFKTTSQLNVVAAVLLQALPIVLMSDPSDYRPEKKGKVFRDYSDNENTKACVRQVYTAMHTTQTVEYVRNQLSYWCKFAKIKLTIMEALELLNKVIDESDPDTDLPNIVHAFQTAGTCQSVSHSETEYLSHFRAHSRLCTALLCYM